LGILLLKNAPRFKAMRAFLETLRSAQQQEENNATTSAKK
jgi:hypothetical protein